MEVKIKGKPLYEDIRPNTTSHSTLPTSPSNSSVEGTDPEEIECVPEIDRTCLVLEEDESKPQDLSTKSRTFQGICTRIDQCVSAKQQESTVRKRRSTSVGGKKSKVKRRKTMCGDVTEGRIEEVKDMKEKEALQKQSWSEDCDSTYSISKQYILCNGTGTNKDKPYACDLCNARFSKRSKVTDHRRTHTGERPFVCGVCGAAFVHRCGLYKHRKTHSGDRPYTCNICGAGFAQGSYLTRHRRIHSGEKPFVCDMCDAKFPDNASLKRHQRVHSGEKPYVCNVCAASFSRSNYLVLHKRTHSGEKPYRCDLCTARFTQKNNLVRHRKMHSRKEFLECG